MKPRYFRSETVESSSKLSDILFRFLCATHGLHTGLPIIRRLGLFFWIAMDIILPVASFLHLKFSLTNRPDHASLSQLASMLGILIFALSTMASTFIFMVKHETIGKLLKTGPRNVGDVLLPMLCATPALVYIASVESYLDTITGASRLVNYTTSAISTATFFAIYYDVIDKLSSDLEALHQIVSRTDAKYRDLVKEKIRIRREIKTVNSLFALPLSLQCFRFFDMSLYLSACLITGAKSRYATLLFIGFTATHCAQIYIANCKASRVISRCLRTEKRLLTIYAVDGEFRRNGEHRELLTALEFREEWDSIRMFCFTLRMDNVFRCLPTILTCMAVILQFDFKVVRALQF